MLHSVTEVRRYHGSVSMIAVVGREGLCEEDLLLIYEPCLIISVIGISSSVYGKSTHDRYSLLVCGAGRSQIPNQ